MPLVIIPDLKYSWCFHWVVSSFLLFHYPYIISVPIRLNTDINRHIYNQYLNFSFRFAGLQFLFHKTQKSLISKISNSFPFCVVGSNIVAENLYVDVRLVRFEC